MPYTRAFHRTWRVWVHLGRIPTGYSQQILVLVHRTWRKLDRAISYALRILQLMMKFDTHYAQDARAPTRTKGWGPRTSAKKRILCIHELEKRPNSTGDNYAVGVTGNVRSQQDFYMFLCILALTRFLVVAFSLKYAIADSSRCGAHVQSE